MKKLKTLIFGARAKGEPLPPPKLKTITSDNILPFNKWVEYVNFGSRYGHKGSFYKNT